MFNHTETTVVLVDHDKSKFVIEAEQLDGKRIVVATEARWDDVKKHLADARDVHGISVRATNRAMNAVKKQVLS
jgi:hypothetical protein